MIFVFSLEIGLPISEGESCDRSTIVILINQLNYVVRSGRFKSRTFSFVIVSVRCVIHNNFVQIQIVILLNVRWNLRIRELSRETGKLKVKIINKY